jgi:hypothetical protein
LDSSSCDYGRKLKCVEVGEVYVLSEIYLCAHCDEGLLSVHETTHSPDIVLRKLDVINSMLQGCAVPDLRDVTNVAIGQGNAGSTHSQGRLTERV